MSAEYDSNTELKTFTFNDYTGEPIIALDIDEVLWEIVPSYLAELNKLNNTNHSIEDVTTYNLTDALGCSPSQVHYILHNTEAFSTVTPFQHTKQFVEALRSGVNAKLFGLEETPHHIVFITHRGFRPDGYDITLDLLKQHNILPDTFVAAPMSQSKREVLQYMFSEKIKMIVEDQPAILNDFRNAGYKTCKSLRPWNTSVVTDYTISLSTGIRPV